VKVGEMMRCARTTVTVAGMDKTMSHTTLKDILAR
jgi:hypothetical protein